MQPADAQPELALRMREAREKVNADSVRELCGLLRGRRWQTARELRALRPHWDERFIRDLASASGGRVISGPGTPGYCHYEDATLAELERTGAAQLSQGRKMVRRGTEINRQAALRRKALPA